VVAQPDERHANKTASVLEWYNRIRTFNILVQMKKKNLKIDSFYFSCVLRRARTFVVNFRSFV